MNAVQPLFAGTTEKVYLWIQDLMSELRWNDPKRAFFALRAVLHTLRDRLTVEEAVQLSAQLPTLLRGFYFEGWVPSGKPSKEKSMVDFFDRINLQFKSAVDFNPEEITSAVFRVLSRRISPGEIEDVKANLPFEIRNFWNLKTAA
jgi:uncharacterized protein (DUF2267 family)